MKTVLHFDPKIKSYITYPYAYWDDWYTENELIQIEDYCKFHGTERALVVSEDGQAFKSDIRPCNTKFHYVNSETQWFFEKTAELLENINDKYFQYDLWGFDGFQYTEYAGNNDRYGYHMDMITGDNVPEYLRLPRKLSMTLILSNQDEYEGGEFEFNVSEENLIQPEQKRGRAIIFPSFMLHKVNPVTSGTRRSIVFWITGPKFR